MRILTYTSLFPNSTDCNLGIFIYQRAKHLGERPGNTVTAVAPVPYAPAWLKGTRPGKTAVLAAEDRIGDLPVFHPRYFLLPKISMPLHAWSMYVGSLPLIRKLHRQHSFDCIDAHFVYPDGMAAVWLGRRLNIPVILSARGSDITLFPKFRTIRPMIRWTLEKANALIAVSSSLKREMVKIGAMEETIHVITNGVEAERFRPTEREDARRKLNLPLEIPILVSAGALVPVKDHGLLIAAFRRIAAEFPNLRLYIVGEGPQRKILEETIERFGLGGRIILSGKRGNDELPLWFNAADVSCLTSEREGWPNVLTESLACGTPVVATRVGGVPEILHSQELGIVVERTPESVAMGLQKALGREWDRERIAAQTRERTWKSVAGEVEAVLREQLVKNCDPEGR